MLVLASVLKEGSVLRKDTQLKSRATSKDINSRGKQDSFSDDKNFSTFSRFSAVPSRMSSILKDQKENSSSNWISKIKNIKNDKSSSHAKYSNKN